MRTFTVEHIDKHDDGSITVYGTAIDNGDPIVHTYQPHERVIRIERDRL